MSTLTTLLKKLKLPKGQGGTHPSRDWLVVVGLSMVLIAASVAWNATFFVSALKDEAVPATVLEEGEASAVPVLREVFEQRAQQAARYEASVFVDPSL